MNQDVCISVIVPVYRVEAYLRKCVDSILAQTYSNLEILLVDDGSPDNCGAICEEYAQKDSRVRVIHKRNGGLSSARNAGLDAATGDYVAFVDSDDWIAPDTYEAMLSAMQKHQVRLVCAGRFDVDGETETVGLCPTREEVVSGKEMAARIFRWDNLDSAAVDKLYARDLFREIRYPVGKLSEDVPTTYRLALLAGSAALIPKPVYYYYHRPNSITTTETLSEKSFHNMQHAARIHAQMRESMPELEKDALYFLVRSEYYLLMRFQLADAESRERFAEPYQELLASFREHLPFLLKSPLFSRRDKVQSLMMAWGLYPAFRKLYHLTKK